jgi:hypothetical protein
VAVCLRAMSELWPPDPGACEVLWTPHARRRRVLPWWRLWCAAAPVVGHALMPLPGGLSHSESEGGFGPPPGIVWIEGAFWAPCVLSGGRPRCAW